MRGGSCWFLSRAPDADFSSPLYPILFASTPHVGHKISVLIAFLVSLTIIILPDPLEMAISGVLLNIKLPKSSGLGAGDYFATHAYAKMVIRRGRGA